MITKPVKGFIVTEENLDVAREIWPDFKLTGNPNFDYIAVVYNQNFETLAKNTHRNVEQVCKEFIAYHGDENRRYIYINLYEENNWLRTYISETRMPLYKNIDFCERHNCNIHTLQLTTTILNLFEDKE